MNFRALAGLAERAHSPRGESVTISSGYFWFYAGIGAFVPYLVLYYRDLGWSGLQLGLLTAIPALMASLTAPFWGVIADSFGAHRAIMRIVLLVAMTVTLLLAQVTSYLPFLLLLAVLSLSTVPIPALWDSYAVSAAERGGASYGTLRVFGSLGFISVVLLLGGMMSGGVSNRFLYAYAVCHILTWLSTLLLPPLGERRPRKLLDGLKAIRTRKPFLLLLLVAYLIAVGMTTLNLFLGVHVRELGSGTGIVGTAFATSALSELPIIGFGTWIMTRIGARQMVVIALIAYIVRFAILGLAPDAAWVIVAQVFHGVSFGGFLVASVTLAHRAAGPENAATAQALLGTMSYGFGNITASLIGGSLVDLVGTRAIYLGVVGLMGLALLVFLLGGRMLGRDQFEPPRERPASDEVPDAGRARVEKAT